MTMPQMTGFDVRVTVTTTVCDRYSGELLTEVTTSGASQGDSADGLPKASAPALAEALAHHAPMVESYRRHDREDVRAALGRAT